ncbi:tyrosine-type recombinase/integrase [Halapricum desulfuricans]|uniref:XerD/XerC family integrase n=1 Tax=Halapricum desulfuricans TaxID=2841257 RepID=A0A897MZ45_9EURY|nr:site-specific integrase [Halapricum desulfuricans]QSG05922.1 XerD/XerC family integrase [Halapricum desulfuricans]
MTDDLDSLHPREALELWTDRQKTEKSDGTVQSYYYRVRQFVDWLEDQGITNLNDLTGRDVFRYDSKRRSDGLSKSALNNQLGTVKLFLQFCAQVEAVPAELPAKVDVPTLSKAERANEEKISAKRAKEILSKLETFDYASRDHVLFALAWHTGARLGSLCSLDVRDCYLDDDDLDRLLHEDDLASEDLDEFSLPFLYFRHRPETDTPLKNQEDGERPVGLSDEIGQLLQDYIEYNRVEAEDEHGRKPLFSSQRGTGRMSKGGLRTRMHIITQPCRYGPCPHDRDTDTCEALEHGYESRCPSSRSPHRIRTGSITHHRDEGWPPEVLAERVNATPEVIRTHYDQPDLLKRMESRRNYLD